MSSRPDLAVIAPCLNESLNVQNLVARVHSVLSEHPGGFELVLVDDGSTDDTWAKMTEAAQTKPCLKVVRHIKNRGIVESWRTGLLTSKARRIVTIDADMQYRPEDIPLLVSKMDETGADFVQGWRQTQKRRGLIRFVLTWGFSWLLNFLFGMDLKDNKSGFVLYRREVMRRVLSFRRPFRYFQHFISIAAFGLGYRIVQIPITFDERTAGTSFITNPWKFSIQSLTDLPRAFIEYRVKRRSLQQDRSI